MLVGIASRAYGRRWMAKGDHSSSDEAYYVWILPIERYPLVMTHLEGNPPREMAIFAFPIMPITKY
jgi:hypothetical protein